jgi:hypothetical protein
VANVVILAIMMTLVIMKILVILMVVIVAVAEISHVETVLILQTKEDWLCFDSSCDELERNGCEYGNGCCFW